MSADQSQNPSELTHPTLHLWLVREKIGNTAAGELFGVSRETVRKWRLAFDDPQRQKPQTDELMATVVEKTRGEVTVEGFHPLHLRRPERRGGDPTVLRHGRAL